MSGLTQQRPIRGTVDTRLKIAALWIAMLFIFAYVDLFSLYRPDVRADLEAGRLFTFDVTQTFLFFTTLYIVFPSLMIYLTLVMPRGINRVLNVALVVPAGITGVSAGPRLGEGKRRASVTAMVPSEACDVSSLPVCDRSVRC